MYRIDCWVRWEKNTGDGGARQVNKIKKGVYICGERENADSWRDRGIQKGE